MKPLIRNHDGTLTVAEEGDGWVVVKVSRFAEMNPGDTIVSMTNNPDLPITVRRYVPPVPPLPTEPYTVIRAWVEGSDEPRVYIRAEGGVWFRAGKTSTLRARVLRFEVLSEPIETRAMHRRLEEARQGTAKAVLDRVRQEGLIQLALAADPRNGDAFDTIARDFGVAR